MKNSINIVLSIVFICLFVIGCTDVQEWGNPLDDIPPGSVSDISVENLNGGCRIMYKLPSDSDLLGVKAVYKIDENNEQFLEAFSSAFKDTIELIGFPDTRIRTIQLVSIDKSENQSEPVDVKIQPLTPPVQLIRESFEMKNDFGGVVINWDNQYEENIGISLYAADSTGDLVFDHTLYTNSSGTYAFRGYDATERGFQIQIRDRWGNYSEPLDTLLTPLFEEKIEGMDENGLPLWMRYGWDDGSVTWRGDVAIARFSKRPFENIFDGSNGVWWHPGAPGVVLGHFLPEKDPDLKHQLKPYYFTLDLGRECILNRHIHYFPGNKVEVGQRYYEIWATNKVPKGFDDFNNQMESLAYWTSWPEVEGTDSWKDDWVKIATCDFVLPSGGTTLADMTADDKTWLANNGFEFMIDREFNNIPFRYIRFECQPTYGATTMSRIGEIEFYGVSLE